MRGTSVAFAILMTAAVGVGAAAAAGTGTPAAPAAPAAAAGSTDLTWYFYEDESSSALLSVVAEGEIDSPEPHYPFLMTCSPDQDWSIVVSDINAKELGETIAKGEQPTFSLVVDSGSGKPETSEYFPDISFNQQEGQWEYSAIWDLGALDHLITAKQISIKGTGINATLPTKAMTDSITQFKSSCEGMSEGGTDDNSDDSDDSGSQAP